MTTSVPKRVRVDNVAQEIRLVGESHGTTNPKEKALFQAPKAVDTRRGFRREAAAKAHTNVQNEKGDLHPPLSLDIIQHIPQFLLDGLGAQG